MKGIKEIEEIEGMMWGRRRPHTPARAQGALPRARPADSPLQRLRRKDSRRSYPLRSSSLIVATAHRGSVAYRSPCPPRQGHGVHKGQAFTLM